MLLSNRLNDFGLVGVAEREENLANVAVLCLSTDYVL